MGRGEGRIVRRGDSIQLDFYYRGIRCRETLKLAPTKPNLRYAQGLMATIQHEIATGTFRYARHFPDSAKAALFDNSRASTMSVGDALDRYLIGLKSSLEKSTCRDYESAIRHHLKLAFGHIPLRELSTRQIREWIGGLVISAKRINNVMVPLRGMLADAHADGIIDRNPMDRIRNLTVRTEEPDPFTPEEREAILAACLEIQHRNLFQFAFWTGLRTSELIALEWRDVDWRRSVVRIRRAIVRKTVKTTKTRAGERDVLLLAPAMEALQCQRKHTELIGGRIFHNPRTGQPWETDGQIRKTAWTHILRRAGVRYRNPYQTRHTYASTLLSAGENPMWVAQQMGHSDWAMIRKVYGRWIPEVDKTAGQKIAAMLNTKSCDHPVTKDSPFQTKRRR